MGFGNEVAPCGCNKCIRSLPTVIRLSARTRYRHNEQHGVPLDSRVDTKMHIVPPLEQTVGTTHDEVVEEKVAEEGVDMALLAKDLVLLVINHDVTWKAAEKMLKLVNAHLLGKTLHEKIPATAYQLKKATGSNPGHSRLLHVCRVCDFVFDAGQALCTTCAAPPRPRSNHKLLINDVGIRVTQMFANPAISKVPKYII